jgi:hypothetical protein
MMPRKTGCSRVGLFELQSVSKSLIYVWDLNFSSFLLMVKALLLPSVNGLTDRDGAISFYNRTIAT